MRFKYTLRCQECGEPFQSVSKLARFCCDTHRGLFNRRRRDRGAELYDFIMTAAPAQHPTVARLVAAYRDADRALRAGRRSYQSEVEAMAGLPAVYGENGDNR